MPEINETDQQSVVQEKWSAIRSAIRTRWPEITTSDLREISGDSRKLVALVNQKTSMSLSDIEAAIDEIAEGSGGLLSRLTGVVTQFVDDARDQIEEPVQAAVDSARGTIQEWPAVSLFTVFSAGMLAGLGFGLLLTLPEPKPAQWWR
jgi:hypothetical protein